MPTPDINLGVFARTGRAGVQQRGSASTVNVPAAGHMWPITTDRSLLAAQPAQLPVNFPNDDSVTLIRGSADPSSPGGHIRNGSDGDCSGMCWNSVVINLLRTGCLQSALQR